MTFKPPASPRLWSAAFALVLPAMASAWQSQPPRPAPPRPVIVVQPPSNARFQQVVREQQVRDQLQKNQVEEQLRQARMDAVRRPYAANAAHAARLDQADQAQRELYRARQQDLLDRYQSAVAPPLVHSGKAPASSRSGE
jgi:ABC-type transporter MlaC component